MSFEFDVNKAAAEKLIKIAAGDIPDKTPAGLPLMPERQHAVDTYKANNGGISAEGKGAIEEMRSRNGQGYASEEARQVYQGSNPKAPALPPSTSPKAEAKPAPAPKQESKPAKSESKPAAPARRQSSHGRAAPAKAPAEKDTAPVRGSFGLRSGDQRAPAQPAAQMPNPAAVVPWSNVGDMSPMLLGLLSHMGQSSPVSAAPSAVPNPAAVRPGPYASQIQTPSEANLPGMSPLMQRVLEGTTGSRTAPQPPSPLIGALSGYEFDSPTTTMPNPAAVRPGPYASPSSAAQGNFAPEAGMPGMSPLMQSVLNGTSSMLNRDENPQLEQEISQELMRKGRDPFYGMTASPKDNSRAALHARRNAQPNRTHPENFEEAPTEGNFEWPAPVAQSTLDDEQRMMTARQQKHPWLYKLHQMLGNG